MRLAVTGVTGFIGSNLARMLVAQGHEVTATGRAVTPTEMRRLSELQQAGVQVLTGNLLDAGFASEVVGGTEAIIHLAAAQHEGNVPDSYFHDVNVGGIQRLLEAAIAAGVRRFVYGSTIGVYGSAMDGELDEESTPRPENAYARTKLAAESVVEGVASRIETSIIRISETYGPGDFRLLKLFKAIDRGAFVMLGSGENLRQVIYVDDLNRALIKAVDSPAALGQTFVLCGSEVMNTSQMVQGIARAVGRKRDPMRVPVWPFRAAAAVFEATLKPLGIQPPLTQRRLDFFTKSFIFSTRKTREVLGFVPEVTFADGAARTAAWYRQAGYL